MKKMLLTSAALALVALSSAAFAADGKATPGKALDMVLLPKFSGNAVFDQAHNGAIEAQKELQNSKEVQFLGAARDPHRPDRSTSSPTPPPRASPRS